MTDEFDYAAAQVAGSEMLTHDGLPARKNADGSYSTEVSITVMDPRINGGKPTNIPSLWGGYEVPEDEAVSRALASGRKYSAFGSIDEAVRAAKARSEAGGAALDRAAGQVVQGQRTQLRSTLYNALLTDPEVAARAQRLGRKAGLPSDLVERNLPQVQRSTQLDEFDTLLTDNPVVAGWLADQNNAKVAHDDVENLIAWERAFREARAAGNASQGKINGAPYRNSGTVSADERSFLGGITEPVQRGLARGRRGITMLLAELGLYDGAEADLAVRLADQNRQAERFPVPEGIAAGMQEIGSASTMGEAAKAAITNPRAVLETTLESLGVSAPSLVGAAGGSVLGPGGTATGAGLGSFAVEYAATLQDVIAESGASPSDPLAIARVLENPEVMAAAREKAVKRGVPIALFDALTAGLAGKLLAGAKATPLSVGGRTAGELGLQAGGGAAGEATAQAATGEYKPGDILMEALAELPTAGIEVPANYRDALARAQQADAQTKLVENSNSLAKASKLAQRDPETFQSFVARVAEEGPVQQIFIDGKTLMQSGVAEQIMQDSPSVAAQLVNAAATGGQVAIPVDEYAARIAPKDYAQSLLDHLKTEPEGFSRAEAQQYMQDYQAELQAEVERTLAEKQGDDGFKQSVETVKGGIKAQLDAAARFTPQVNDAYASMVGNFYAVTAAKLGITPEELYQRYPLKVGAEAVAGQQFDQGGNLLTDTPAFRSWFGDSKVTDTEGKPLVVYHGTASDFSAFEPSRSREDGTVGSAIYVTEQPDFAERFANGAFGAQGSPSVMPLYVRASSIADLQTQVTEADIERLKKAGAVSEQFNLGAPITHAQLFDFIAQRLGGKNEAAGAYQQAGFDGLRFRKPDGETGLAVFKPEQVKSAVGNRGTFNPNDPNILRQSSEEAQKRDALLGMPPVDLQVDGALDTDIRSARASVREQYDVLRQLTREQGYGASTADGRQVRFSNTGFKEVAHHGADRRMLEALANLDTLFANAIPLYSAAPEKPMQQVKAFHYYGVKANFGAGDTLVMLEVVERTTGSFFHDIDIAETAAAESSVPLADQPKAGAGNEVSATKGRLARWLNRVNNSVEERDRTFNQSARGAFNPETLQITLLKNADLSTFLHESGHAFLEMQLDLAARLQGEAETFGLEALKPGEQELLADAEALLKWFGVRDLPTWFNLDFEEKRSYHEQFARGFEAYLFEGKAPSIELQGLFQRFRAWLLNVYKNLKALNVELTDEVRGVMDRMLATTEQIQLAEQARSMMPLFTSPDQAGMTPEEFAAYQALGVDATNEAIQDLQARGLRDMQWLRNARGREIKKLQKQAKEARAAVQMDVRSEVMSQPIYRAWAFLTGKLGEDDKLTKPEPPKSNPDVVDPTQDSLLKAIAKLGGVDKAQVLSEWGVDPKYKPESGVFGKPVWRREGGLPLDTMATLLAQHGYLPDNYDLNDFFDRFDAELRGDTQYSYAYIYEDQPPAGVPVANPLGLNAGRLDLDALAEGEAPIEVINVLKARKMTANAGLHPDTVAEMFGFTSGDELARKLAEATPPREEIEALTDVRMLEQYGELSSPEAIEKAADRAVHNDVRARMVATEANALAKAVSKSERVGTDSRGRAVMRPILPRAAREFARTMIARLKVRDIKPGQYANAEVRAAKAAEKASKSGNLAEAAAEKRNQLINLYAAREAHDAQDEVDSGLRYLKKFDSDAVRKSLDADYTDQIDALLERFDLRRQSLKAIDKRAALAEWIKAQREAGLEPDIPAELENEAFRKSYRDLTVEKFRGLVDTVRQIEHLGRLKHKLLTAKDQRAYEAVRDAIVASVNENAQNRSADTRTPTTNMGRTVAGLKRFWASHIKAATWARVMDGGKDGGPMWEYFVRGANERGDMETTMRAEATAKLSEIMAPVLQLGRMGGKGQYFASINRSLNREARIALALNTGNAGNLQRLLDGEGWTLQQAMPVLQSLTAQEWQAVQAVWDHFETYRPLIAAKERRIYGKEPVWIEPQPLTLTTADGETITLRGGYYPIKYDPAASQRAEEHADAEDARRQLQGAYTTATTRRSFTKARAEEVKGRPLLYTLAGMYSGVNDVIHDLAWHEWLIDTNRLLRSHGIDQAIREHYGPEAKQQFKTWVRDIAEGERGADAAVDIALSRLRQGISAAGLGFNVMTAMIQPLGLTQSITRVGAPWIARGMTRYLAHPVELTREVNAMSSFMENRARTRFRELNELRNKVQDQTVFKEVIGTYAYWLMMRAQQMVDVPTWWGAYEKAIAEGNEEARAIALADQAVIDSQGGGMTKDLSAIERGGPAQRLFTVFYNFMNTALNLGVAQTMSPHSRAKLAVNYAMLYVVPAVLSYFLKAALTPGDDDGDDDLESLARKLAAAQIDYLMGLMVVVREFSEAGKQIAGANDFGRDYTGPAGLRLVADTVRLAKQGAQGEFDDAFRKAAVNVLGDLFGLPSAQVNRTITGAQALVEGDTENPAALAFGFQQNR